MGIPQLLARTCSAPGPPWIQAVASNYQLLLAQQLPHRRNNLMHWERRQGLRQRDNKENRPRASKQRDTTKRPCHQVAGARLPLLEPS
jgi:hypothetical protein